MTVRRALAFSYAEKYGSFVLSLLSTMAISRLLGPAEIGVFSIGMALVSLVAVVREFGISTYLLQEAELNEQRIRAAFTLTVGLGVGLSLLVLLLSIPAGRFYGNADVTSVVAILALNFALTPFGGVAQALLTRDMHFGTLTWIRLSQSMILAAGSVALAAAGLGPQSLAWGAVMATLSNVVMSYLMRPHPIRLTFARADLRRVFAVGGPATAIGIIDDIDASLPELLLGRLQTVRDAGLFSRARGMSQMAHQLLARAAAPVFLAVFADRQRKGESLAPLYAKATACVTAIGWVALAMLAVLAEPVVRVLFGANWLAVVPLMRWLCLAAAIELLTSGAHHLLLACGAVRNLMRAKLVALPVQVIGLWAGASLGVEWMAIAMVLSSSVKSVLLALAVRRRLGIDLRAQLVPAIVSAPITAAAFVGASVSLLMAAPTSFAGSVGLLLLGSALGLAFAAAVLATGPHPLKDEVALVLSRLRRGFS